MSAKVTNTRRGVAVPRERLQDVLWTVGLIIAAFGASFLLVLAAVQL